MSVRPRRSGPSVHGLVHHLHHLSPVAKVRVATKWKILKLQVFGLTPAHRRMCPSQKMVQMPVQNVRKVFALQVATRVMPPWLNPMLEHLPRGKLSPGPWVHKGRGGVCVSSQSNRVGEALPSSLPSAACRSQHSSQTKKRVASAIESDAESQDLSGCQPEKPRKHFKPAVQASTQAKQASFVAACPHCPYKVAWQTQAQCRSCLRYHCKKHHPEKPQPKPLPRRKGKRATYEDLVRVPVEGEQLYWQCSLCNMADTPG